MWQSLFFHGARIHTLENSLWYCLRPDSIIEICYWIKSSFAFISSILPIENKIGICIPLFIYSSILLVLMIYVNLFEKIICKLIVEI